jgi:hypothetical protein
MYKTEIHIYSIKEFETLKKCCREFDVRYQYKGSDNEKDYIELKGQYDNVRNAIGLFLEVIES